MQILNAQARRFLLRKQLLMPPQMLQGKHAVEKVFQTLRLIQYDPLNPCGRNTDLVLQARIRDYHPQGYYDWLYLQKKGLEMYDKELCILPIEDVELTRNREIRIKDNQEKKQFLKKYQKQIAIILQTIEKNGPISSQDVAYKTRVQSGWGTDANFGRIVLETLWRMGRIVVVKRANGKKYYDLPHKFHHSLKRNSTDAFRITREHILKRLGSVGLLPLSGSGGGWQGLGSSREVRRIIKELVADEILLEVNIEGLTQSYVILQNDLGMLHDKGETSNKKVVFLAPLDNLLWDRQMLYDLFHFYYRWEVYTPVMKRQFGYYVLPILYGDTFIGRIEPILQDNILDIRGFWQEDEKLWTKDAWRAFAKGLENFRIYLQAREVIHAPKV